MRILALTAFVALALAGCLGPFEGTDRVGPEETIADPNATEPQGPAGVGSTGCVDEGQTGTGTGDIGSDVQCPTNETSDATQPQTPEGLGSE